MKKSFFCLLALIGAINAYGQSEIEPINTGAVNFLTIPADAQTAGMGGAGVAVMGKDNAIFSNAATVMLDDSHIGGAMYSYSPWMRDYKSGFSLHSTGGFYKIDNRNAILAGFRFYNYPRLTSLNNEKIDFRPQEMTFDVGYAREILPELAVSGVVKYIRSDMGKAHGAKTANAVAFDIGAVYKRSIPQITDAYWTAGLQVSNIGTKIKYLESKESLPAMAKVGGSVDLPFSRYHRIKVAADGGYRMMPSDVTAFNVSAGAEYILIDHFMLRGGYHYGDKEKGDNSYASAGAGIDYFGFHVDFAWLFAAKDNPIRNTFFISANFSF